MSMERVIGNYYNHLSAVARKRRLMIGAPRSLCL